MNNNEKLQVYTLSEVTQLKVHGRYAGSLIPLPLFWTGSGIELNARGSELWVEVEVDYQSYEPWISVQINSAHVSRQMLTKGRYWICLFRGMSADKIKNVRFIKETQPMSGDPACVLLIHAIKFDGTFLPVEDKTCRLEFIGDSITSGEGAVGGQAEEDWIPMWCSAVHNYTAMTAQALNADYRVISQSGWGVMTGWDNNPHCNIPRYYGQVCGLLNGESNEALRAFEDNDFSSWQPDAVVINLGTNDYGAFHSPEWTDPLTGQIYKQRLEADGSCNAEDLELFVEAACSFLGKLRGYNPKAHLIWAYGMLGIPIMPAIYRAVDRYVSRTEDLKVSVFQLPDMTPETTGARAHPGLPAHEYAAKELSGYMRGILGSNR